jgi:Zn-dependent alcohol dehydrogenase
MQALIKDTPEKGYTLKELPIPEPKDDEVLIKVEKASRGLPFSNPLLTHDQLIEGER